MPQSLWTLPFRPVPKEGSDEPSRPATKVPSTEQKISFLIFCLIFVSGPYCNHSVFTARIHKIAGFSSIFPKFSPGKHATDPLEKLRVCSSTFWSALRQQEPTRQNSCVRPCHYRSWQSKEGWSPPESRCSAIGFVLLCFVFLRLQVSVRRSPMEWAWTTKQRKARP